ncbi:MAG: hypothetical protein ACK5O9_07750 [Holosporales bacterium]|jgi:hypothetical protein
MTAAIRKMLEARQLTREKKPIQSNDVTPVTALKKAVLPERIFRNNEVTKVTEVTPKTMVVEEKNQDAEDHLLTLQEREAHIHGGGHIPLLWAEGYARLDMMPTPAAYKHRAHLWALLKDNVGHFLDQWGKEAAAAGWTVHDLFAVHRVAPMARYDQMGLLPLLETRTVTAVDEKGATLLSSDSRGGARQRWNRRPYDQQRACMVWELPP